MAGIVQGLDSVEYTADMKYKEGPACRSEAVAELSSQAIQKVFCLSLVAKADAPVALSTHAAPLLRRLHHPVIPT